MVDGPVSKRKVSRRTRRNILYVCCGVLLASLAGFAGWKFTQTGQEDPETANVDAQEVLSIARPHAQSVATFFENISADLAAYAASETVKNLFLSEDDAALAQESTRSLGQFPAALKLRLLRPGQYQVDNNTTPPLSFGSIAILNKAERSSGPIAAEVLLFGTDKQHIVLVERVKNPSDQLIGIVHLSLDVDLFQQALMQTGPVNGYLEIRQSASGNPLVLGSRGDSGYKTEEPGTASIAGTRWTLAYWSPPKLIATDMFSGGSGNLQLMGLAALTIILFGIAGFLLIRRKAGSQSDSLDKAGLSYAGAIKEIMDGAHPGMEKLIVNIPGNKGGVTPAAGISRGMEGDDITSFMGGEQIKAAAEPGNVFDMTAATDKAPQGEAIPVKKPGGTSPPKGNPPDKSGSDDNPGKDVDEVIFRKYDIRGVVDKNLTAEVVNKIGLAIGSEADEAGIKTVVVGRDGRNSSPELAASMIKGLTAAGRNVIDIGIVPTPVLYFATHHLETGSGVMVTGSHNGPEYNGLKIVLGGTTLSEQKIRGLYDRITAGSFSSGSGNVSTAEIIPEYIRRITEDIPVAFGSSFKLVIDCGNGAASVAASQLYRAMGHDVIELYCELDGNFPNHHPDPSQPENLEDIINKVKEEQADLGFAFDGDGDRLGVVDGNGNVLWPDRQMMIFARDVLSRNQGAEIIFDVKCSSNLKKIIEESGGRPLMWKTGHSLIKSKMKEVNAPLAGEMSGHIFFSERWYGFDDALYSGARMLEILTNSKATPAELFAELPNSVSTPELRIDMPESEHQGFMAQLESKISFDDAEVITVDGFRIEFANGWGLIRPSNTTPCLIARFEADTAGALTEIQDKFRTLLKSVNPDLTVPF